jgi:hypothetical protein
MDNQQTSLESSVGCGLAGCAGGVFLGVLGGSLLIIFFALGLAGASSVPASLPAATADLRVAVSENFLNQFIQPSSEDSVRVDVLPSRQFLLTVDTSISLLGVTIPFRLEGLFDVQLTNQSLVLRILETKISDATLPPQALNFFSLALPGINQEINTALDNLSTTLGIPLVLVDAGSDEDTFWLEARESP